MPRSTPPRKADAIASWRRPESRVFACLQAINVGHLFGSNTTRIGLRRGTYIRQFEYDFIEMFASQLTKKAVDMAMAGTGVDDAYQL